MEQLGMPHGTASARLRKAILLYLLQQLGEDFCYRCGGQIETPEELSIEHKKDWQGVDPALFWDLDNIAFSHRLCNRPGLLTTDQAFPTQGCRICGTTDNLVPRRKFCEMHWREHQRDKMRERRATVTT
jgi:hypothetical protein